jgi:hypothetical protein
MEVDEQTTNFSHQWAAPFDPISMHRTGTSQETHRSGAAQPGNKFRDSLFNPNRSGAAISHPEFG